MAFKHPEYLWFLLAIAIPIIIHLFSFRKHKKVYFHNLQFIKKLQTEQNSTKSRLKEWLILASRIGAVAFLAIGFAQPYIPREGKNTEAKEKSVAIYIDNSFSSQTESAEGIVLEVEKQKALQILDAYPHDTKFFLLTNDILPTDFHAKTKEDARNEVTKLTFSPYSTTISEIQKRMSQCAARNGTYLRCHILTDAQKNICDTENFLSDTTTEYNFHIVESQRTANISIDTCHFENRQHIAGQTERIIVKLTNNTDGDVANLPIRLYVNDTVRAISSFSAKQNAECSVALDYTTRTPGLQSCRIEIDDYPIQYDNTYYFSYTIDEQISILNISETSSNPYIAALCKGSPNFSIENRQANTLDYSTLSAYSVIILDGLHDISTGLTDAIAKLGGLGKSIICIPSDDIDTDSYNRFFALFGRQRFAAKDTSRTRISSIDSRNPLFADMFEKTQQNTVLPEVRFHYPIENPQNNAPIVLENHRPFITQIAWGKSTFFTFSSPLSGESGGFATSPLFVGIYNMLLASSLNNNLQYTLNENCSLFLPGINTSETLHITSETLHTDVIPQYRIDLQSSRIHINPMQQINTAGNYTLTQNGKVLGGISYNYNRKESQLEFYSKTEMQEILSNIANCNVVGESANLTQAIQEIEEGTLLWRRAILAALFFLLAEITLILFYDKLFLKK